MKFREYLKEDNIDNIIKKIASLTDDNDHGEARVLGVKLLKDKKLEKEYDAINKKHKQLGHLPSDLSAKRYALDKKMWAKAKIALSPEQYKKFHGAY